jgi:hypothetical protein
VAQKRREHTRFLKQKQKTAIGQKVSTCTGTPRDSLYQGCC